MTSKKTKLLYDQTGAVSMIVGMLIMLMLTLIVLAMAQNAGSEQRQALDRQLSDQAFYNAESGINDVVNYLYETANDTPPPPAAYKNDCGLKDDTAVNQYFNAGHIDGVDGANKYTCVLYDKAPATLVYDDVGTADSRIVPIQPVDASGNPITSALETLTISWDDAQGQADISGCNFAEPDPVKPFQLPATQPANCIGGVRVDLIPGTGLGTSREALNKSTRIAYLLPGGNADTNGNNLSFDNKYPIDQGVVGIARCGSIPPKPQIAKRNCGIILRDNMPTPPFTLHIKSLYKGVDINIEGTAGGLPVRFNNAQILIDSTGKASDVLRRIQVRVPAQPQFRQAEFTLQSKDSVCKIIDVDVGSAALSDVPYKVECPIN